MILSYLKNRLTSLIGYFKCRTGHHAFEVTQQFSPFTCRIACRRCRRVFAMHDDLRALVPWDADFHRLYRALGIDIIYKDWEFKKEGNPMNFTTPYEDLPFLLDEAVTGDLFNTHNGKPVIFIGGTYKSIPPQYILTVLDNSRKDITVNSEGICFPDLEYSLKSKLPPYGQKFINEGLRHCSIGAKFILRCGLTATLTKKEQDNDLGFELTVTLNNGHGLALGYNMQGLWKEGKVGHPLDIVRQLFT